MEGPTEPSRETQGDNALSVLSDPSILETLPRETLCQIVDNLDYVDLVRLSEASTGFRDVVFGCVRKIMSREREIPESFFRSLPGVERVEGVVDISGSSDPNESLAFLSRRIRGNLVVRVRVIYGALLSFIRIRSFLYPQARTALTSRGGGTERPEKVEWWEGRLTVILRVENEWEYERGLERLKSIDAILPSIGRSARSIALNLSDHGSSYLMPLFSISRRLDILEEIIVDNIDPINIPDFLSQYRPSPDLPVLRRIAFQNLRLSPYGYETLLGSALLHFSGLISNSPESRALRSTITRLDGIFLLYGRSEESPETIIPLFPHVQQFNIFDLRASSKPLSLRPVRRADYGLTIGDAPTDVGIFHPPSSWTLRPDIILRRFI